MVQKNPVRRLIFRLIKLMCADHIGSDHFSYIRVCLQIQVSDMMMEVSV